MKFHNFVIPHMFIHFSSRFDESGQKCDEHGANQYIGGYISYSVTCEHYIFYITKNVTISAGNARCSLYREYANTICTTGGLGTYRIMCKAINEIRKKL